MFEGLAHIDSALTHAAWIVAAPFWLIVLALGVIAALLWQQRKKGK
jgi:hypothetical protein